MTESIKLLNGSGLFPPAERPLKHKAGNGLISIEVKASLQDKPPMEEPPNEPEKPPFEEPGKPPAPPRPPKRPPVERPPNDPGRPPVEEPPHSLPIRVAPDLVNRC